MRGDRLVERQEPDGGLTLLTVLPVERVEHFLDRFGRAEELIEVRAPSVRRAAGTRSAGFPCSRYCRSSASKTSLRGPGRAEDLVQQGSGLLVEPELRQRLAGSIPARAASIAAGASIAASGGGALPSFKSARSSSDCRRMPGSTGLAFGAPS